jgi:hypothetical protein
MREGKIFFTLYHSRFTDETATGIALMLYNNSQVPVHLSCFNGTCSCSNGLKLSTLIVMR